MKLVLFIALLGSAVVPVYTEEVSAPLYGFSATFPGREGWSAPVHTRKPPHDHVITWSAKSERTREMIYVSIINAPFPGRKPTFQENALEWGREVRKSAKEIVLQEFTTLGGYEAYRVDGKVINFGVEYYFVRWMAEAGDVTYQVSYVSETAPDWEGGVFHDFLSSVVIKPKTTQQPASGNPGKPGA